MYTRKEKEPHKNGLNKSEMHCLECVMILMFTRTTHETYELAVLRRLHMFCCPGCTTQKHSVTHSQHSNPQSSTIEELR